MKDRGTNAGLAAVLDSQDGVEVLFVDDSTDGMTPGIIEDLTGDSRLPVRMIHRQSHDRAGGLAGGVVTGVDAARGHSVVVMDGDFQHPPELVPALLAKLNEADLVIASRYSGAGDASGLSSMPRSLSGS